MGTLRPRGATEGLVLYPEHTLGRSKSCGLQVPHPRVSGLHAVIFWADESWHLKDLGSRNGSFVNGKRVEPGERVRLPRGAEIDLGVGGPTFELVDDTAPLPLLVAADDPSFRYWIQGTSLALPSEERPEALLYLENSGGWQLQTEEGVRAIDEHGLFTLGRRMFRVIASRGVPETMKLGDSLRLSDAALKFSVSADEEHVELRVETRGSHFSLGHRAHHYLLLTLARARKKIVIPSITLGEEGWIEREALERMLRQSQQHINLGVWRARRQFAEAGFSDAENLVERRGSELRLGPDKIEIERG